MCLANFDPNFAKFGEMQTLFRLNEVNQVSRLATLRIVQAGSNSDFDSKSLQNGDFESILDSLNVSPSKGFCEAKKRGVCGSCTTPKLSKFSLSALNKFAKKYPIVSTEQQNGQKGRIENGTSHA